MFSEYLKFVEKHGVRAIACRKCDHIFCYSNEDPKEFARVKEVSLSSAGGLYYDSDRFLFRQFYCPECGTMFGNDVAEKGSPILWETKIDKLGVEN